MTEENNLSELFYNSLLAVGARKSITFLPKGDPQKAISLSGIELHEKAVEMAFAILRETSYLQNKKLPILLGMVAGLDFVITFIGSLYAGVTIVPIPVFSNKLQQERIKNILNDCNATDILCDETGYETLKEAFALSPYKIYKIAELAEKTPGDLEDLAGFTHTSNDPAYIQYTSGSSMAPKGILLSHANVIHNLNLVGTAWNLNKDRVVGSWLPHYHDMGLGTIILNLLHQSHVVFMSPLSFIQKPIRWFNMIDAFKVSLSGGPPFAFNLCYRKIDPLEMANLNLSTWDLAYLGSEVVPKKTIEDFSAKFAPFGLDSKALFACYGMAESTLFIAGHPHTPELLRSNVKNSSSIEPCYLSDDTARTVVIVDFETKELLNGGQKGEIWLQSPSLAAGYLIRSKDGIQITSEGFKERIPGMEGEWFRTGDVGFKDGRLLYILGRLKDVLKINGLNVSALDIEWYACEVHPNLNPLASAVFITGEEADKKVFLLIETFSSELMNIQQIKKEIRAKVNSYFSLQLEQILILKKGSLDRTTSGKIRRYNIGRNFNVDDYLNKTLS